MGRKVKIKSLPKGFILKDNKIIKEYGGTKTGDQAGYGLTTFPKTNDTNGMGDSTSTFFPSKNETKYTLQPDPRKESNVEAEKNETVLTDLNFDGDFEFYNIGGKRHNQGGTPLNLPEQSFIYSDTRSMKLTKDEMAELNINSKKRITPAKVSKNFELNKFTELLDDPYADKIQKDTADYMLDKNKNKLSHLAFVQEAKKDFEEGVPKAAFPYLKKKGIDPIKYADIMEKINTQQEALAEKMEMGPTDQEKTEVLMSFLPGNDQESTSQIQQPAPMQQNMPMNNPMAMAQGGTEITDFEKNWNSSKYDDLKEEFYAQYAAVLDKDELSDEEKTAIDKLLIQDTQMKTLMHDNFESDYFTGKDWDAGGDQKNARYNAAVQKLIDDGLYEGEALTEDQIKEVQNAHIVLNNMSVMPEYEKLMTDTGLNLLGPKQKGNLGANQTLSRSDGVAGDNFINTFPTTKTTITPDENTPKINLNVGDEYVQPDPGYWLQDNMNLLGSIMDKFSIKKRGPVLSQYQPEYIDAMYLSPTRQFAKIGEMAAQATKAATTFAGPQRALAVASKVQGEAMKQLANVQADTDNKNLAIFTDVDGKNTIIRNQFEEMNKRALSDFYDKTQLTEENYDTAIRNANQAIGRQLVARETNRAMTKNLNTLYPAFDIDPTKGGDINVLDYDMFFPTDDASETAYNTKVKRIKQLIDDELIDKVTGDKLLLDIINTDLNAPKANPYENTILNQMNYPSYGQFNQFTNPLMQQLAMLNQMNQQNRRSPYGEEGMEVGYVPVNPFTLRRPKRKLVDMD